MYDNTDVASQAEDFFPFDRQWLDPILQAIGGFDGDVHGLRLNFETGAFVTVTIFHGCGSELTRTLDAWDVVEIAQALELPFPAQTVTLHMEEKCFAIMECRLVPKNVAADAIIDALKKSEKVVA